MKIVKLPLLAMLALAANQAHAIPISYSMSGNGIYDNPVGSFTYDVATNRYSNVSIWSLDYYASAGGSATAMRSTGLIGCGALVDFQQPAVGCRGQHQLLRSRAGLLTFSDGCTGKGAFNGGSANVPEPDPFPVPGVGLAGLGIVRRRSVVRPQ